jgi:hypothetical protein
MTTSLPISFRAPQVKVKRLSRPALTSVTTTMSLEGTNRSTRVLIVDDESSIRTFAERVLGDAGALYFTGYADRLFHEKNVLWEDEPKAPDGASALSAVTKPTPDETCRRCGSLLFPPHLAPGMMIPAAANFVCLNCGRAYEWTGTPPRLSVVAPNVESGEDEDD